MTGEMDAVMAQKVENDAAAGLRSLCIKRCLLYTSRCV